MQELEFENHRWRNQQLIVSNLLRRRGTEPFCLASKKPDHNMGIQIRHFFSSLHSLLQSMWTKSSGSPMM